MKQHNHAQIAATVDRIMARNRALYGGSFMEAEGEAGGETAGEGAAAEGAAEQSGEDALGEAGKQALARMKAERRDAERRAKAAETELETLRSQGQSEQEKAVTAARKEGESAALARVNSRLITSEARAIAAELGFTDPTDAVALVNLSEVAVDEDGEVDTDAVKKSLKDLADRKKYLLKSAPDTSGSDAGLGAAGAKPQPGTKAADLAQIEADLATARRR